MAVSKIAISLDKAHLALLDSAVRERGYSGRSQAIQAAISSQLGQVGQHKKHRLARELAKLDPKAEVEMAEWGLKEDAKAWPAY